MKYIIYISTIFTCISYAESCTDKTCDMKAYYHGMISTMAKVLGVPEKLMIGICTVESTLKPSAINWSPSGRPSVGLCQIQPRTARSAGFPCPFKGNTSDYKELYKPQVNVLCATKHMADLLKKYDNNEDYAIAAYNLGHVKLNERGEIWNRGYVNKVRKVINDLH